MAFKAVSARVRFLENWLCLSLWKKSSDNKKVICLLLINLSKFEVISIFLYVAFLLCVVEDHFIRCSRPSLLAGISLNYCRGNHQIQSLEHELYFSGELKQNIEIQFFKISVTFCQIYYIQKIPLNLLRVMLFTALCGSANENRGKHKHTINKEDIESWFLHVAFCLCVWKLTSWCWNVDCVLHFASCFYWKACVSKGVFSFYKALPP